MKVENPRDPLPLFGDNHNDCMFCMKVPGVVLEDGSVDVSGQHLCFHRDKWFLDDPIDKTCKYPGESVKDCPHYQQRRMSAPDDGVRLKLPIVKETKGTGFIDR